MRDWASISTVGAEQVMKLPALVKVDEGCAVGVGLITGVLLLTVAHNSIRR